MAGAPPRWPTGFLDSQAFPVTIRIPASPKPVTRNLTVTIGEKSWPLRLKPRKGSRQLRMVMKSDHLSITGPTRMSQATALAFVKANESWILAHLPSAVEPFPVPFFTNRLLHLGKWVHLDWSLGDRPQILPTATGFIITLPEGKRDRWSSLLRSLFVQHWTSTIQQHLGQDLGACAAALGRGPSRVRFRPVKSLWGSLDIKDVVTLDLSLAMAQPAALRYVWIHELCHLRERNHSPRFWAWVAKFCPEWKKQRAWLNGPHGKEIKGIVEQWLRPA